MPATTTDELERAHAFMRAVVRGAVSRTEPLPWGTAYFREDLPVIWDLNTIRVERPDPTLNAQALAADAERLQGAAGLEHRRIVFEDEVQGARLSSALGREGWRPQRFVVMVHRHEPDHTGAAGAAREVDEDTLLAVRAEHARSEAWARDEDTVTQAMAADRLSAAAGRARRFAGFAGDRIATFATLYSDGRTAQVEDVGTLEAFRGRGLARAVVSLAVRSAREAGHDLVFLVADADDWPRHLYRKLGFEEAGHFHQALVLPPGITL